jgi:hypothetical protein
VHGGFRNQSAARAPQEEQVDYFENLSSSLIGWKKVVLNKEKVNVTEDVNVGWRIGGSLSDRPTS